jgi:predicted enzyme related to lactoylglutathione lyase
MKLAVNRIIYFTNQMKTMTAFYRDVIGLSPIDDPDGDPSDFLEFDAGTSTIALHKGSPGISASRNKIVFQSDDVEKAREGLINRGVRMGKLKLGEVWHLCDGKDPEGNIFQISNR